MVGAYREPDKRKGKSMMQSVIDSVASGVPAALLKIRHLGRTLKQRAVDVLAFFDRPGTSNAPQSNQRLARAPPRVCPRFRNASNYVARSLLESGGIRPALQADASSDSAMIRSISSESPHTAGESYGRSGNAPYASLMGNWFAPMNDST